MVKIYKPMVFAPFTLPRRRNLPSNPHPLPSSNSQQHKYYSKNAFRYICRIAMKEGLSLEFRERIEKICVDNKVSYKQFSEILSSAESISGPRYFERMLESKSREIGKATCQYLLWFLEKRYMRYLCSRAAGRQKMMNKEQYVKYKNYVMIPMIRKINQDL